MFGNWVSASVRRRENEREEDAAIGLEYRLVSLLVATQTGGGHVAWSSGGNPGGDEIRLGFGLVKEIVAGVLFPSGLG